MASGYCGFSDFGVVTSRLNFFSSVLSCTWDLMYAKRALDSRAICLCMCVRVCVCKCMLTGMWRSEANVGTLPRAVSFHLTFKLGWFRYTVWPGRPWSALIHLPTLRLELIVTHWRSEAKGLSVSFACIQTFVLILGTG